ncbi:hypothetical protein HK099_006305 [Clydaea vesicula]|uniref:Uncharacterized protein n=1 Tax=Clydaea vesicula TaxID=447962 RepID=A0AAD5TYD4_9FUNG|nr:hypothetical protein HK099_006305 [Clydaea vesicula]KAJ3381301.1 hypothetical protein HDU92_005475 [Lobulomyces angularis]
MTRREKSTRNEAVMPVLMNLQHDLRNKHKEKAPKLTEIQDLAERTWKANFMYENRLAKLEKEKRMLENTMKNVWEGFDKLILPMWRIDDDLVPVYENLVEIKRSLEALDCQPFYNADDSERLLKLQEQLHNIENEHCVNGLYVPIGWKRNERIPSGQSILASLMARNYKLVRHIQERGPTVSSELIPLESRLRRIIQTLDMIKENYTAPYEDDFGPIPIEPLEIRLLQDQLAEIEGMKENGMFYAEDGSIPSGQAVLHSLLEEAYDLVHDCLIQIENQRAGNKEVDLVEIALSKARYVSDSIVTQASAVTKDIAAGARSVSLSSLHALQASLDEGSYYLRKVIENPSDSVKSTSRVLASTTRAALGFLSKLYGEFEPVDPSLLDTYNQILKTRNDLKLLRNEFDLNKIRNEVLDTVNLNKRLRILQEELDAIDRQKVDGKFVNKDGEIPRGQALLSSILDESYCLVAEML